MSQPIPLLSHSDVFLTLKSIDFVAFNEQVAMQMVSYYHAAVITGMAQFLSPTGFSVQASIPEPFNLLLKASSPIQK